MRRSRPSASTRATWSPTATSGAAEVARPSAAVQRRQRRPENEAFPFSLIPLIWLTALTSTYHTATARTCALIAAPPLSDA